MSNSNSSYGDLTPEIVHEAFNRMGRIAAEDGKCIEIIIYGGSCIMLASDIRGSTKDVDAIFKMNSGYCYEVADAVGGARQLRWPVSDN